MTEEELLQAEQLEAAAMTAAESDEFGRAATLYRQILETYPDLPVTAQRDFGWNLGLMYRRAGDDELAARVLEHYGFTPTIDTQDDGGLELLVDPSDAGGFSLLKWTELHGSAAAVRSLGLHRERAQMISDNADAVLDDLLDLLPDDEGGYRSGLASALTAFRQASLELKAAIDACVSTLDGDKGTAVDDAFDRVVGAYGHGGNGFVKAIADLEAAVKETVDTGLTGIAAGVGVGAKVLFSAVGIETSLRKGIISGLRHPSKAELAPTGDQLRLFGKVVDLAKKLLEDHHKDIDAPKAGDHPSQVDKLVRVLQRSHEHNRVEFEAMGDFTVDDYDPQTGDYHVTLSTGARGRLVKQLHYRFVAEHGGSQMLDDSQKHRIRLATAWLGKNWPDKLGEPPRNAASDISWNLDGAAFVRTLPAERPSQQPYLYNNVKLKAVPNYQEIAHSPDLLWKQPCFGNFTLSLIIYPDGSCRAPTEDLGEAYLLTTDGAHHESVYIENVDALVGEQQATRGWANVARGHLEYHYAHSEVVAARNWTLITDGRYTIDAIYREHWDRYNDDLDTPFDTWMAFDHSARISHLTHPHGRHKRHGEHHHGHPEQRHHEDQSRHGHRGHDRQHGRDRHQSHREHREHKDGQFHYGYQFAFADYPTRDELYDREYSGVDGTTLWEFIKTLRTTIDERQGEVIERAHALVLVQFHNDAWYASVYVNATESRPVVQYRATTTSPGQLSEVEDAEGITIEESDTDPE